METAVSTISILPATRDEQHRFASKMVEELLNGEHDVLKVWQQMSIVADTLNEIKESNTLKQAVIAEVEKYGKDGAMVNGCKITKGQRRNWDYSETNDSVLTALESDLKSKKDSISERQKFLQNLKPGIVAYDEITGEQLNPPKFSLTEYVIVK